MTLIEANHYICQYCSNVKQSNSSKISTKNNTVNKSKEVDKESTINKPTKESTIDKTELEEALRKAPTLTASTPSTSNSKTIIEEKPNEDISLVHTFSTMHHCTFPSSMLELFSSQFELLSRMIDDLKFHIVRKPDAVGNVLPSTAVPATEELTGRLITQILSLEKKIDKQSTKLEDLQNDHLLLLQENKVLKDQMDKIMLKIGGMFDHKDGKN